MVNPIDRPNQGFGLMNNGGWLLEQAGCTPIDCMPKLELAHRLLDRLLNALHLN